MANINNYEVDGVSYTYDMESRSPLSLDNVKKAFDGKLVYTKDEPVVETAQVFDLDDEKKVVKVEKDFVIRTHKAPTEAADVE